MTEATLPKIRAIAPWFGGKRRMNHAFSRTTEESRGAKQWEAPEVLVINGPSLALVGA